MVEGCVVTLQQSRERVHLWRDAPIRILFLVAVICTVQLWWFGRICFNEIDADGMSYTGIARHIRAEQFRASINAFRSPLLSWMIAAVPFGSELHIGKLINVASFLLCVTLLYVLAERLWHSRFAGAVAALLFALARGLAASAVEIVTPDFLFAVLVLVYFLLLLRALRSDKPIGWFLVGAVHGVAFLAKAFALPWLGVCTVVALAVSGRPLRSRISRLVLAAFIPVIVAAAWASVLHSKYGVFTTGTQFKTNLLQWTLHNFRDPGPRTYSVLTDVTGAIDEYGVGDPMPPGSWAWSYRLQERALIPAILAAERRNVPLVFKELCILATPGGILAFLFGFTTMMKRRRECAAEWKLILVITASTFALVLAYSMLVFDERYLFPLLPLLLAVSGGFLAGGACLRYPLWHKACVVLVGLGVVFSLTYHASPFRFLTRDFESVCYNAGRVLHMHNASHIVTIGSGPFPEHGVGWEAGYKAAYFANARVVATLESLPEPNQISPLIADVTKVLPDAIVIWGRPKDPRRAALVQQLLATHRYRSLNTVSDPALGDVAVVMLRVAGGPLSLTNGFIRLLHESHSVV